MRDNIDFNINLVVSGTSGVGKTSFIERFSTDKYSESYNPTISLDLKKVPKSYNGKNVLLNLYDTAG